MQELSFIRNLFLLIESPWAIAGICLVIMFWLSKLAFKGVKLEFEILIEKKASKKALEELKEELQNDNHRLELKLTFLESNHK